MTKQRGYLANEHVQLLTNGRWTRVVIIERKTDDRYIVRFLTEHNRMVGPPIPVRAKELARVSVWVCGRCGNWLDDRKLPTVDPTAGIGGKITFQVQPVCRHDLPYCMVRRPWTEVPGVSAIGGLHARREEDDAT
jgi:hypothetical protein